MYEIVKPMKQTKKHYAIHPIKELKKTWAITLIFSNFFSFIKELKRRIRMNINFMTHWFTHTAINLSNLYLILSFHHLPHVLPQRPQVLTAISIIITITRNSQSITIYFI